MAANDVANTLASYKLVGTRVALVGSISATPTALEWELLNTNFKEVWPHDNKALVHHGFTASGKAVRATNSIQLGRAEPAISVTGPLTPLALAIMTQSLWQHEGWDSVDSYDMLPYNTHAKSIADMFLHIEGGIAGASSAGAVYKMKGGVVSSLEINLPPVDAERGRATFTAQIMGASSSRTNAFTSTSGMTVDDTTPIFTSQHALSIDSTVVTMVSLRLNMTNNLAKGINAGETPTYMALGELAATGEVSFTMKNQASDDWEDMIDAFEAGTVKEILWSVGATYNMAFDARIGAPRFAEQANVIVVTLPFEAVYVDDTRPSASVNFASDRLNWSS